MNEIKSLFNFTGLVPFFERETRANNSAQILKATQQLFPSEKQSQ